MKKKVVRSMKKRGIIADYLPWILIGVAILAILVLSIAVLKDKGITLIDKIGDIFTGG